MNSVPESSNPNEHKGTGTYYYTEFSKPLAENIQTEKGQFVMMVSFNKLEYDKKYHSRSIKKTLSIPEWLNTAALKRNINFSNVLQNALIRELNIENNLS